jgi:hypothetical protein
LFLFDLRTEMRLSFGCRGLTGKTGSEAQGQRTTTTSGTFMHFASLKRNLSHHSLIFVVQEMAVKQRHTSDNWIGEVHDKIY